MPMSFERPTGTILWGHDVVLADDGALPPEIVAEVQAEVEYA